MSRIVFIWCLILVSLLSLTVLSQVSPLIQPQAGGYTAQQHTALEDFITALESVLSDRYLGSQRQMGQEGWGSREFSIYSAGVLRSRGYETAVVAHTDSGGHETHWVLIRSDLGGAVAWIPVEASPHNVPIQQQLGYIPRSGFTLFDTEYMVFSSVHELPANVAPTAVISPPPTYIVAGMNQAWFSHRSVDPGGKIILYTWNFDGQLQKPTSQSSIWYSLPRAGAAIEVTLTVTDNLGGQGTTTLTVHVLTQAEYEAEQDCGCNK